MKKKSKILIIQTAFLGDVILATALLEKLKLEFNDCKIDFLLKSGYENILANNPRIHKVYTFDKSNKLVSLLKNLKIIRAQKYDLIINCQRFFSSGLLTVLSNAKETVGFDKNPFSFLYTKSIAHTFAGQHETQRNQLLIAHLTDNVAMRPYLHINNIDISTFITKKYITISPASVWYTKQFPASKWIEFLQKIPKDFKIFFLGAPSDLALCQSIAAQLDADIEILAGKFSFLQSAALMQKAQMNYVNDSAPLHLASAVNAPVCAIYCSTLPTFGFGPLSSISYIVQTNQTLKCRPCGIHGLKNCPEKHFNCANSIGVFKMLQLLN